MARSRASRSSTPPTRNIDTQQLRSRPLTRSRPAAPSASATPLRFFSTAAKPRMAGTKRLADAGRSAPGTRSTSRSSRRRRPACAARLAPRCSPICPCSTSASGSASSSVDSHRPTTSHGARLHALQPVDERAQHVMPSLEPCRSPLIRRTRRSSADPAATPSTAATTSSPRASVGRLERRGCCWCSWCRAAARARDRPAPTPPSTGLSNVNTCQRARPSHVSRACSPLLNVTSTSTGNCAAPRAAAPRPWCGTCPRPSVSWNVRPPAASPSSRATRSARSRTARSRSRTCSSCDTPGRRTTCGPCR